MVVKLMLLRLGMLGAECQYLGRNRPRQRA